MHTTVLLQTALLLVAGLLDSGETPAFSGRRHALVIGIGDYQDADIRTAAWAQRDAETVYALLAHPDYGRFHGNADLLVDGDATRANIEAALGELAARVQEQDMVVVYFASHGLDDEQGNWHWIVHDTLLEPASPPGGRPIPKKNTTLEQSVVVNLLNAIPAQNCVVFMDCGFSPAGLLRTTRGVGGVVASRTRRVVDPISALQGEGRVVVTASGGDYRSPEMDGMRQGAFAYSLVRGLRGAADANGDNIVSLLELFYYLSEELPRLTSETGIEQTPTMSVTRLATARILLSTYPLLAAERVAEIPRLVPQPPPPLPREPQHHLPVTAPATVSEEEEAPAITTDEPETASAEAPALPVQESSDAPLVEADSKSAPSNLSDTFVRVVPDSAPPIWVSAHEVTNIQFAAFIAANPAWGKEAIDPRYHDGDYLEYWSGDIYPEGTGEYPVVRVSWFAAKAYAEWRGGRLLTESEWEFAARGNTKRFYPWGNEWEDDRCNSAESNRNRLTRAGTFPAGASRLHDGVIHEMAGNAAEWCNDAYYYPHNELDPEAYALGRTIKGGSFRADRIACLVRSYVVRDPKLCSDDVGFRICLPDEAPLLGRKEP